MYREYFYSPDQEHCSTPVCRFPQAHTNFVDESACLTADNVRNEITTTDKSQEVLKMLSSLHVDIFRN
jgi:hypothetical protein